MQQRAKIVTLTPLTNFTRQTGRFRTFHKCIFISVAGNDKDAAVDKVKYVRSRGKMFVSTYQWLIFPPSFVLLCRKCRLMFLSNVRKSQKPYGLLCYEGLFGTTSWALVFLNSSWGFVLPILTVPLWIRTSYTMVSPSWQFICSVLSLVKLCVDSLAIGCLFSRWTHPEPVMEIIIGSGLSGDSFQWETVWDQNGKMWHRCQSPSGFILVKEDCFHVIS